MRRRDVCDGGVAKGRERGSLDGLEEAPGGVLEGGVAGYAVEDEDGFDCFGTVCM